MQSTSDGTRGVRPTGWTRPLATGDTAAYGIIAAVFVVGWFAVRGRTNVAVIDDWLYAGIVEQFLNTGRIRIPEFSAIYPVAQLLWGALFCRLFGFSFGILRASTACAAAGGCCACYSTLRHLGAERATALLVALAVALNPVFFMLSFSFMTDVPFVSALLVATWLYVSAVTRQSLARWWIAGAVAVAAFLIRPVGLGLPVAAALALWRQRRPGPWAVALGASLLAMATLWFALPRMLGPLDFAATRLGWLRYWTYVSVREYAEWNLGLLFIVAFPLAPLLAAATWSRRTAAAVAAVTVILAGLVLVLFRTMPVLLNPSQTWSLRDFAARALIEGEVPVQAWASRAGPLILAAGVVLAAALVVAAARLRSDEGGIRRAMLVAVGVGAVQWGLVNLLWLYNDRYYLVLLPAAALLATRLGRVKPIVASVVLAAWAYVGITGTRDAIAFNAAVASAAGRLEASGVAPADIDAGYVSNGWRLYMHPERLAPGSDRRYDVPFVTGKNITPYAIANSVPPGATPIETIALPDATWQATRWIYVIRR